MLMAPFVLMFQRSGHQGAQNIIQAVLEDNSYFKSGYFYRDFQLATRENGKVDGLMDISDQLWSKSEEATNLK